MPSDNDEYNSQSENFLIAPGTVTTGGKSLPGLQEALIAAQILKLAQQLPAKTAGLAEIKKGAYAVAGAGAAKLAAAAAKAK